MTTTPSELPRDVLDEIRRIAHFGRAPAVTQDVEAAVVAVDEDRLDDALEHLQGAKHHAPRAPTIRELIGLVHYQRGEWREAARELATYRRLSGRTNQDHLYADAIRALGRPEKAIEVLEELDLTGLADEIRVEALIIHAGALRDLERAADAVELLKRGPLDPPAVLPYHLRLWYALADALEESGKRSDARSWWDAIYAEDPTFFDVDRRRLGIKG